MTEDRPHLMLGRILALLAIVVLSGCTRAYRQEQQLKRADRSFELKRYHEASIEYVNVLKKEATNVVALSQLGLCSLELGNPEQGLTLLRRASQLAPENSSITASLARAYLANGSPEQARPLALAALQSDTRPLEMLAILVEAARSKTEAEATLPVVMALQERFVTNAEYQATSGLLALRRGDFLSAETHFRQALARVPSFARGHLGLAMLHHAKGEKVLAKSHYQTAAELAGPQSPEAIKWALYELETGKPDEARRIFERMATQPKPSAFALLQLIKIAMSQRRFEDAAQTAETLLKQVPGHIEARLLHAQCLRALGRIDEGLAELQELVQSAPRVPSLRYELALSLLKTKTPEKAIPELKVALQLNLDYTDATLLLADLSIRAGDATAAILLLNDLVAKQPGLAQPYILLGAAHQALGQFERALQAYAALGKLDPHHPQAYYLSGLVYLKQGQRAAAVRAFSQASQLAPGFALPLAQLVTLDLREQQNEQALRRIEQAIQQAPESGSLCFLRGQVTLRMGRTDEAETAFKRAIELAPDSSEAYVALSRLYLSTQRTEAALRQLTDALKKNPDDPACLMLSALLWTYQQDLPKAVEAYERLLAIKSGFIPALNNLACLYADKLNQLDKARTLSLRAREVAPRDPCVADTLGWILYRQGEIRWAASLLQESAEALPAESEVGFHLALAQLALGCEPAAAGTLRAALDREKGFPQKDQATRLLALLEAPPGRSAELLLAQIQAVLKDDPRNPAALTRMAALRASQGDPSAAMRLYEQVQSNCPTFYPALSGLATLLQSRSDSLNRALDLAKQARESAPNDPDVAHVLGWIAYQKGQYRWALSLLLEAAGKDPRQPQRLFHLALAKYRMGETPDALALMREALELKVAFSEAPAAARFLELAEPGKYAASPQSALQKATSVLALDPNDLPALMLEGWAYEAMGNAAKARACYEALLSQHRDFAPALLALASLYAASGELKKALETAGQARVLMPDSLPIAKRLGTLSLSNGNAEYAAALLQEVVTRSPRDAEALLSLGQARMRLKENEAARKILTRVIEVAPASTEADTARHWLGELGR